MFNSSHSGRWWASGTQGALLDTLFETAADQAIHVDPGSMDLGGIQFARLDDFLHLDHSDASGRSDQRIKILRCMTINHVTEAIGLPPLHDREVPDDGMFQQIVTPGELARLLPLSDGGPITSGCIERRNPGAAGPQLLRQRSLGSQLDFKFTVEKLPFEESIFPNVGRDHLADLSIFQEDAEPEPIHAAVVGNYGQAAGPLPFYFSDQVLGDTAQAESTCQHRHAILQSLQCLGIGAHTLVKTSHVVIPR